MENEDNLRTRNEIVLIRKMQFKFLIKRIQINSIPSPSKAGCPVKIFITANKKNILWIINNHNQNKIFSKTIIKSYVLLTLMRLPNKSIMLFNSIWKVEQEKELGQT